MKNLSQSQVQKVKFGNILDRKSKMESQLMMDKFSAKYADEACGQEAETHQT